MRTYEEYRQILELWELGYPKLMIADRLKIPRATVRDCINRFSTLTGLEANKENASPSTPDELLRQIRNPNNKDLQRAYVYLLGVYLGDGYIIKNKRVYVLRIFQGDRYPNLINGYASTINFLLPDNKVNILHKKTSKCVEVVCYYKFWPALFPQHGAGRKHTREVKLQNWQQTIVDRYPLEMFRGLYHTDGSRHRRLVNGKDYPSYSFTNLSEAIIKLYCYVCELLGIHWTEIARPNGVTDISIAKRKDVAWLDIHVGPKS
jgi:hypothetical protein